MIKIITSGGDPSVHSVGGKGKSLIQLASASYAVPDGFILEAQAFFDTLEANGKRENIQERAKHLDMTNFESVGEELRDTVNELEISDELREHLHDALLRLDTDAVAVRSSAISEDSKKASFAGLHESRLNVPADLEVIGDAVRDCWRSLYTNRAIVYRLQKGLSHWDGMAVVVQELIDPDVSGITLTAHPMDDNHMLIESSFGFGDIIVGGEVDPDEFRIDRDTHGVISKSIGSKKQISKSAYRGVTKINNDNSDKATLTSDEVKEIAEACMNIENLFGYPQDIEWCCKEDNFYLLQSRPITGDAR
jgi:pyruvate,water dikinase